MKILHCCLSAFYIDNYGYQENILPKMHKLQNNNVMILASTETFIDNINLGYVSPKNYINEDGISVHRIPYKSWIPHKLARKLRLYKNVYNELDEFKPDIIFLHDAQFLSIGKIIKYLKNNRDVKLYVDGHTDFSNSARSFLSKFILHGIIYKWCVKKIIPYTEKFYGTLPARVDFFVNFYGTPKEKTELLVMGADDQYVQKVKETNQRELIRKKYNISEKTFLLVSGGKFDNVKMQILNVMEAIHQLSEKIKIKMLIFGSIMEGEFKEKFNKLCDGENIQYIGWIKSIESYNYYEASDLVIFPGRHSVLWEQAVGLGKPCIFKYFNGHSHIDLDGNCKFIYDCTVDEIKNVIIQCIDDYSKMCKVAMTKGVKTFSYYEIAKRSIQ